MEVMGYIGDGELKASCQRLTVAVAAKGWISLNSDVRNSTLGLLGRHRFNLMTGHGILHHRFEICSIYY